MKIGKSVNEKLTDNVKNEVKKILLIHYTIRADLYIAFLTLFTIMDKYSISFRIGDKRYQRVSFLSQDFLIEI